MIIQVRGFLIRVTAKTGSQYEAYKRLYSGFTDTRLKELEWETLIDTLSNNINNPNGDV